ncbi:DUF4129 domain-containing protein [Isoptericola aurantiacus]|uniref:DUF4129 domain-containing protein n=1 Tax=Isoptericola aurantiacus TaxID=3377839 RepID=UPI00383A23AD
MRPRDAVRHPAVLFGLVGLAVLGAAAATPWTVHLPDALLDSADLTPPAATQPPVAPSPAPQDTSSGQDHDVLLTALLALAALALALLLWYGGRRLVTALRDAPPPPPDPDHLDAGEAAPGTDAPVVPLPELTDAVTRALAHLEDAPTPDDAVVAAWIALEEVAAEHGTRRHPAQTPTEFTQDVLGRTPAPPDATATLRTLYQQARFTGHPTRPAQVEAARAALTGIARALEDHRTGTPT